MQSLKHQGSQRLYTIWSYFNNRHEPQQFKSFLRDCLDHGQRTQRPEMKRIAGDPLPLVRPKFPEVLDYDS
jgi:hypothetical protein